MSYLKCKDCAHFIEGTMFGKCSLQEYKFDSGAYMDKSPKLFGHGSPCDNFEAKNVTCGQCNYYTEKGKCKAEGMFGATTLFAFKKHYKNQPACEFFKPAENCFLTSACVGYMGKPDDCEELTVLRAFRDGYMSKTEEGKALVEEYYRIAPEIVKKIDASPERDKYYGYISSVVEKCVALIGQARNEEALAEYRAMVLELKNAL